MPRDRRPLTRADVPDQFTPETLRALPISTVRRLADHRNGILTGAEQEQFDRVMHEVMRAAAGRVSQQLDQADWSAIRRDGSPRSDGPGRGGDRPSRVDLQLQRLARRIGQQVDVAETLAPGVDWSFAQTDDPAPAAAQVTSPAGAVALEPTDSADPTDDAEGTVSDLEARISEQVELVEVMSEIAEMSKRTYALEQQRDLQNVRSVFFGFVVSVAVLVAGWAPLVTARDWDERIWMIVLTLGTLLAAGAVYWLVRRKQVNSATKDNPAGT
jgi:hypothetical protein